MQKIRVGVLGATGAVGQRFVQLLEHHPWFELTEVAASKRSAGKRYADACTWYLDTPLPRSAAGLLVKECTPDLACDVVFSGLPSEDAVEVEPAFARAGYVVSSNTSVHRMDPDVPLLIAEVNPEHTRLIDVQRQQRGFKEKGFIVTNPNCTTIMLVMALKPLADAFGLQRVLVTSLQAVSGAGYPGIASLDVIDNVIPYIGGEEEKVETEPLKLLGAFDGARVQDADFVISAHCNRVPVRDGHLECVSVELGRRTTRDEMIKTFREFRARPQELKLPSAPEQPIVVLTDPARPQPRRDRDLGNGMSVAVGRVRACPIMDWRFVVMGHNTIRGAAGAAILNAELLKAEGYL